MRKFILASASPRRRELMDLWGVPYCIAPADIDEEAAERMLGSTDPSTVALHLARLKALAVQTEPDDIVIGVDTLVALGPHILGKPADADDAFRMLCSEQGTAQTVHSGVVLARAGQLIASGVEATIVQMRPVSDDELWQYIRTEKPFDKAGAYAIQEGARGFVEYYEGCYYNIVGMPLCLVAGLLETVGLDTGSLPPLPAKCLVKERVLLK